MGESKEHPGASQEPSVHQRTISTSPEENRSKRAGRKTNKGLSGNHNLVWFHPRDVPIEPQAHF